MKFPYITLEGNNAETEDLMVAPENLELIGSTYFEKKVGKKTKTTKVDETTSETTEETTDETSETTDEVGEPDEEVVAKAKEFLKEMKVKGVGNMKGQNAIDKAVELGFAV